MRQKGRCAKCAGRFALADLEFDHVLPLALGGSNDLANFEALCGECHKAKTRGDIRKIRKADRQGRAHRGEKPPKPKIRSQGFRKDPLHWKTP